MEKGTQAHVLGDHVEMAYSTGLFERWTAGAAAQRPNIRYVIGRNAQQISEAVQQFRAADKVKNKLSHSQHLDQATWATRTWTTLTSQRISVALHIACAWEVTQELSAAAAAAGGA